MLTLGINAAYHDSSACLVRDGEVVACAEDERFTHVKHAKRPVPFSTWELPFHAIDYCLREAGVVLADMDHVAYSYDPTLLPGGLADGDTIALPLASSAQHAPPPGPDASPGPNLASWQNPWDPLFQSYLRNAPGQLVDGWPHHLEARFCSAKTEGRYRWHYVEHHLAHEASAFLASPFDEAAVLTMDGRGERATTSFGHFKGDAYRRLGQIDLPHSLGLLYEDLTRYLGFLHSSDEYKVMALASYGRPRFLDAFREIVTLEAHGRYAVAPARLAERFGPPRRRGAELTALHFDLAASLQARLEEAVFHMADWLRTETGAGNLAMAGGVALNCVLNGRLLRRGPFKNIWVQPAAGDAGTSLGAALWVDREQRGQAGSSAVRWTGLRDEGAAGSQPVRAGAVGVPGWAPDGSAGAATVLGPIPVDGDTRRDSLPDAGPQGSGGYRPGETAGLAARPASWTSSHPNPGRGFKAGTNPGSDPLPGSRGSPAGGLWPGTESVTGPELEPRPESAPGNPQPVMPVAPRRWVMEHAFLGPGYSEDEVERFLRWSKLAYRRLDDVAKTAARLLAEDRVLGWFQGRMEFGPRALGGRSILASPIHADMQSRLNEIKDREDFRPVAPAVLEERAGEWFEGAGYAPFMLFVFDVRADKAHRIPAVRHVDGTARVQTVNRTQHPLYYDLLSAFEVETGVPVLVNTSFNTRGEPVVCTPRDAVESFWTSPLDALVIGPFLLEKGR